MNYDFEEDIEPPWLTKQNTDAKLAELAYNKNEKVLYKEGDQLGNFLFVRYNKAKNRATFLCQECGRKFTYNIYAIKNKKRCKWHKFHNQSTRQL
jgi:transposase-like protein